MMTIRDANQIDMIIFLSSYGYQPAKISGSSYWYHSPFRTERTASFKVNRTINRWFDFAEGKGGNLVDFCVLYFKCSLREVLQKLSWHSHTQFRSPAGEPEKNHSEAQKLKIISVDNISSVILLHYLSSRKINEQIAREYLKEIRYQVGNKIFYALGFKNDAGGYELRNPNFKGSSSPKSPTWMTKGFKNLSVFEGFFNFLSYLVLYSRLNQPQCDFLVLNSASFFERSMNRMLTYEHDFLYLDNDPTGDRSTALAVQKAPDIFNDCRGEYAGFGDLNDYMIHANAI